MLDLILVSKKDENREVDDVFNGGVIMKEEYEFTDGGMPIQTRINLGSFEVKKLKNGKLAVEIYLDTLEARVDRYFRCQDYFADAGLDIGDDWNEEDDYPNCDRFFSPLDYKTEEELKMAIKDYVLAKVRNSFDNPS